MMLAMLLALMPPHGSQAQWIRIGNSGLVVIEVDPASYRVEGSVARFRVRARLQTTDRARIMNLVLDCAANTMQTVGQIEYYAGDQFTGAQAPSSEEARPKRADTDELGLVAHNYICKGLTV